MKNKIFFTMFMIFWILLIVLNVVIKNENFSEQENRYLAKLPSFSFEKLVSGKYQEEMDNYINDHFVFRNSWIKIKSLAEIALGKTENNNVYIGKDGYLFEKFEYTKENKKQIDRIINKVNEFSDKVDIPIYFMLIPNSIYIQKEKLPDNVIPENQEEIINEIYKKLNDNINKINVTDVLLNNNDKYIFFKTDHHMTSLGAYLTYNEFCLATNKQLKLLQNFEEKIVSKDFLGTFDSKAQVPNQETDIISIYVNEKNKNVQVQYDNEITNSIYNEDYLSKKDKYSFFLNGNNAKVVVKTNVQNGKKLLLIKDSYSHIMAQFLCQDYEEVHFIDPRYYKLSLSEYTINNEITEILFLYNVSNIVSDLGLVTIK